MDLTVISTHTASKSCISKSVLRLLCILSLVYIRTPPPGRSYLSFLKGDLKLSVISFSFGVSGFSQLSVKTSMPYAIDSHSIVKCRKYALDAQMYEAEMVSQVAK